MLISQHLILNLTSGRMEKIYFIFMGLGRRTEFRAPNCIKIAAAKCGEKLVLFDSLIEIPKCEVF